MESAFFVISLQSFVEWIMMVISGAMREGHRFLNCDGLSC